MQTFSFADPKFSAFLAEWAELLLTIPEARAVYYVGSSVWVPSNAPEFNMQVTANFIVRTDDPKWDGTEYELGTRMLDMVDRVDAEAREKFFERWQESGWAPAPLANSPFPVIPSYDDYIRVIEVPAGENWIGPEKVGRIPNGIMTPHPYAGHEALSRYNATSRTIGEPSWYWSVDERNFVH